ncbi:MAG TPA: alkyl hydroperoxide reductase, partial [Planctomycetaceae bacterium]|nr:alkyl hydroperoxide reductase [Planctomycetaceae bacterium]
EPLDLNGIDELRFQATFDNSSGNPFNPDPSQWVTWGDQTWEEMAVVFLEVAEPLDRPTTATTAETSVDSQLTETSTAREAKIRKFIEDFFAQVDTNGDGVVAKSEAPIAMRGSFSRFDRNGDNIATKDEVRQLAESRIGEK